MDCGAIDSEGAVAQAAHGAISPRRHTCDEERSAQMALYGIDARARSALRALARFRGLEAASRGWANAFAELLVGESGSRAEAAQALSRFVRLFFELPARDFDPEWLEELGGVWRSLRHVGCNADLPLRAAHEFTKGCIELLKRERDTYSRLDAEIALSVGSASLYLCSVLADATEDQATRVAAAAGPADSNESGPRSLGTDLETALALGDGCVTGLLSAQVDAGSSTMLAIDEDGWTRVNDLSLSRVQQVLRETDVLHRIGRSRFGVILPGLRSQAQVMLAADKLARLFESPVSTAGRECRLLLRMGVAWAPDHGTGATELMRNAQLALHEASRLGRPFAMFEAPLLEKHERDLQMEEEFLRALDCGGLELHFQPQIDLKTGRCVGAEALLRWPSARGGPVPPPVTIEVAQRLGVAPQLTRWILHRACRSLAEFTRLGLELEISINLTAADIGDPELPLAVRNVLDLWHVEARRLKFELTESAMLANEVVGQKVMAALQQVGAATSIDDFGTGYSSVILLKKLPLNELKLDRCFVASAVRSGQDREIVRSLILLAHGLKLEVVAEGVEDAATLDLLREFGCDRAQGYLFSKPLPAEEFTTWLRSHAAKPNSRSR
jgi:EAL domain-containing protein (putative c-di-GMP-specific phosphodiesterase class I)